VRCDARVFRARWKRFGLQEGGALFGNGSFGLNLAWPLPPLGTIHVCDAPLAAVPGAGTPQADGRRLLAGGRELARASSPRQAALWAAELRAPAASAAELERRERERYDTRWIAERRAAAESARAPVLPWAQAQLLFCFAGAPLLVDRLGLLPALPWLLGALLVLQLGGVVAFARAHALLWPAERGARRGEIASIALSPPGLMRAGDLLTRDLFAGRAPLAVASVLLERPDFERVAGRALREARHPPPAPALDPEARLCELRALERFLEQQGLEPARLDAEPERLGEDCLCYCPRCQTQYVLPAGACTACSGVALVPFAALEQRAEAQLRGARGP
jgi:hypothetical protein